MPRSVKARQRRKLAVRLKAIEPNSMFKNCRVIGCRKPARAATGDGLDTRFCRTHADQNARHGSPYRKSFTAVEINPYRRAALDWLLANEDDGFVKNAIARVKGLYDRAGPYEEAFRLRGMPPKERGRKAWARLRHHRVDPRIAIAAWLAVEAICRDDPQAEHKGEFKRVQAAKIVHRLASGTHKMWRCGLGGTTELHAYPASRGKVLRYIGNDIESAVELLAQKKLYAIGKSTYQRIRPRSVQPRRRAPR
jgi:hypothetical protein